MSLKLVVIDYDIGNIRSLLNAFEKVGVRPILSRDKDEILSADGIVLPGVGTFSHGMENLHKYSLVEILKEYAKIDKPLLGICLGMQILFETSEEFGNTKGLGLISGKVIKLPTQNGSHEKLPHVSWNEIKQKKIKWNDTILNNIENQSDMYFVHSFIASPGNKNEILSTTEYSNYEFCSSTKKGNIYGCQFHPEKSGIVGLKVIENFIKLLKQYEEPK